MRLKREERTWLSKQKTRCFTCKHLTALHNEDYEYGESCNICNCTGPMERPFEGPVRKEFAQLAAVTEKYFVPLMADRALQKHPLLERLPAKGER